MTIHGWDASDFDWARGPMDVAAAARDGIAFFTHKATEGTKTRHARYGEALNRARSAGIPLLGAYVVPRTPGNNGHGSIPAQVDYFLSYLDAQTPWWRSMREFFLQVDTEHWGYDDVHPRYGAEACALLRKLTGKWVIHYAPRWAYGNGIPGGEPLWASAYGSNPAVPYRQAYPGDNSSGWAAYSGRTPTFLQFGSKTRIGSQSTCDANAFRGSLDQLRALITGGDSDMEADERAALFELRDRVREVEEMHVYGPGNRNAVTYWIRTIIAERQIPAVLEAVKAIGVQLGVAQADLDAIQASIDAPDTVALDAAQLAELKAALADAVVADPDTPLGDADHPAIVAAMDKFFAQRFSAPKPTLSPDAQ